MVSLTGSCASRPREAAMTKLRTRVRRRIVGCCFIWRILRGRTFGMPPAVDEHESRFQWRIVAGRVGMQRIARQQQHAMAIVLDRLRHAPDDGATPRPCERVLDRLERLDLAQGAP